jgi:hypothetical protein
MLNLSQRACHATQSNPELFFCFFFRDDWCKVQTCACPCTVGYEKLSKSSRPRAQIKGLARSSVLAWTRTKRTCGEMGCDHLLGLPRETQRGDWKSPCYH